MGPGAPGGLDCGPGLPGPPPPPPPPGGTPVGAPGWGKPGLGGPPPGSPITGGSERSASVLVPGGSGSGGLPPLVVPPSMKSGKLKGPLPGKKAPQPNVVSDMLSFG